jgi:hypothetical protein
MRTSLLFLLFLPFQSNALEYYVDQKNPGMLTVQGQIKGDESKRFVEEVLTNDIHTVAFDSMGGNFMSSIKIGKFIREQQLNTIIPKNKKCSSACTYAFMGGVERTIDKGATFAMHRPYFSEDMPGKYIEGYDVGVIASVTVATHLIKMGFNPLTANLHLLSKRLTTFTSSQQRDLNIITAKSK